MPAFKHSKQRLQPWRLLNANKFSLALAVLGSQALPAALPTPAHELLPEALIDGGCVSLLRQLSALAARLPHCPRQ